MSTDANNGQTPRKFKPCSAATNPTEWGHRLHLSVNERLSMTWEEWCAKGDAGELSCQREDDDSDIDPPFDYSTPEDDSDRNGGGDDRKGYECPEFDS
jgi:hypothetical protein